MKSLTHFSPLSAEKAMASHSSTLAWKITWMEEPGRLQSVSSLRVEQTERLCFHFSLSCLGERNGNPLQCSCLENPRDGGSWWAAIYGVSQNRTWLKQLSSSSSSPLSDHFLLTLTFLLLSLPDTFKNWGTGNMSHLSSKGQSQESDFVCAWLFFQSVSIV